MPRKKLRCLFECCLTPKGLQKEKICEEKDVPYTLFDQFSENKDEGDDKRECSSPETPPAVKVEETLEAQDLLPNELPQLSKKQLSALKGLTYGESTSLPNNLRLCDELKSLSEKSKKPLQASESAPDIYQHVARNMVSIVLKSALNNVFVGAAQPEQSKSQDEVRHLRLIAEEPTTSTTTTDQSEPEDAVCLGTEESSSCSCEDDEEDEDSLSVSEEQMWEENNNLASEDRETEVASSSSPEQDEDVCFGDDLEGDLMEFLAILVNDILDRVSIQLLATDRSDRERETDFESATEDEAAGDEYVQSLVTVTPASKKPMLTVDSLHEADEKEQIDDKLSVRLTEGEEGVTTASGTEDDGAGDDYVQSCIIHTVAATRKAPVLTVDIATTDEDSDAKEMTTTTLTRKADVTSLKLQPTAPVLTIDVHEDSDYETKEMTTTTVPRRTDCLMATPAVLTVDVHDDDDDARALDDTCLTSSLQNDVTEQSENADCMPFVSAGTECDEARD